MSTTIFRRRNRRELPRVPGGEVALQPPPEIPRSLPGNLLGKLLPAIMIIGMLGMVALMFNSGGMSSNPMGMMFPAMMVFSMLGMFAGQSGGKGEKTAETNEDRKDYLRYLDQLRGDVAVTAAEQHAALEWSHPEPGLLWTLAGTARMWERRPENPDYGHVRVGRGSQRLATKLVPPQTGPPEELEPIAAISLRRFVRAHSVVSGLATALNLQSFACVSLDGERARARGLARSMVAQMCTFHGPDQLLIVVVCGQDQVPEWEWTKWLPHSQHPYSQDGVGTARLFFGSIRELNESMQSLLVTRGRFSRDNPAPAGAAHIVILVDGGILESTGTDQIRSGGIQSVTVLDLCGYAPRLAASRGLQLVVENGDLAARGSTGTEVFAVADEISIGQAQQIARKLAPFRAEPSTAAGSGDASNGDAPPGTWAELLGLGDLAALNPDHAWRTRQGRDRLRVPFGLGADGQPVELDLKEAAESGMGPHGLCIGATGSGKSEFLRTLVLGLLATHSPDQLNLVLVDFKGGATFLGLEGVPHVAAVITNLEEEVALVGRMKDALAGEMNRRQELLRAAGNFANVSDYEKARAAGAALDPLPALFVVIDEFSELLTQQPDFADLFTAIGRLGRSLHIHLLLASQRLDEGKLRGLESHLSYRIGLKTFSANESRQVLGVPDAHHLPGTPGVGYLKSDSSDIVRFQASYVSGAYSGPARSRANTENRDASADASAREFTAEAVAFRQSDIAAATVIPAAPEPAAEDTASRTNLEVVVGRICGSGNPAHEIWLPPLEEAPTLDFLLPRSVLTGETAAMASLRTPVGIIDRPYDQRRDDMIIDLSGSRGNVAIVGGPQSGKSTALRSLIMSMAMTHTAEQVQFYCLDFGGGTLAGLEGLPHVGSVANRLDEDRVRRTIAEMIALVRRREQLFRQLGIESITDFRRLRATGGTPQQQAGLESDPFGDAFLVIDGLGSIRQDFEMLEQPIANLAVQGLSYGVHVVVAAARWAEIRPQLKDQLGTRIELRLGDPMDSDLGRRLAALVPDGRPGRGMTPDGLHLLMALPRADADSSPDTLATGVSQTVTAIAQATPGKAAPAVRMLPDELSREQMLAGAGDWRSRRDRDGRCARLPIGIDESELATAFVDFADQSHLLIFGDSECGKTAVLRSLVTSIIESNNDMQARFIIADYRRSMMGLFDGPHQAGYAASAPALTGLMGALVNILKGRMPGPEVTPQQLRERSWWQGPDIYLVINDYDLVATSTGNPIAPIAEFLPHSKDLGLHVIIARRSGGAARAVYEPVIAAMRDLGCAGLIMSGSRDEGYLIGQVRPSAMPPGRGTLITRAGASLVQTAWMPLP